MSSRSAVQSSILMSELDWLERGVNLGLFSYDQRTDKWSLSSALARGLESAKNSQVDLKSYALMATMYCVDHCTKEDFEHFTNLIVFLAQNGSTTSVSFPD